MEKSNKKYDQILNNFKKFQLQIRQLKEENNKLNILIKFDRNHINTFNNLVIEKNNFLTNIGRIISSIETPKKVLNNKITSKNNILLLKEEIKSHKNIQNELMKKNLINLPKEIDNLKLSFFNKEKKENIH